MSAEQKIAQALHAIWCDESCSSPDCPKRPDDDETAAVLAAIRDMSPAEQAEVIGGSVLHDNILGGIAVGRWGEVQP